MPLIHTLAGTLDPIAVGDGVGKQLRGDKFGAAHTIAELMAWVQAGAYFRATNPTPGTGLGMGVQAAFSDTANVLALMRNGSPTKLIVPHYMRLICTVAGVATTSSHLAIVLDTANRYSSGGTDLLAQVKNAHSGVGIASVVDVLRFAAITAAAQVAKRHVGRAVLKTQAAPCWVIGDEVLINFHHKFGAGGQLLSGAAASMIEKNFGPVILGGQNHCLLAHLWNPASTTGPSWEVEMAWWER